MALEYINPDNNAPTIRLWQQYKKNEVIVSFFNYLKTYWQGKYFDFLDDYVIPNLAIYNANSDYLHFLVLNLYNIITPIKIFGQLFWDRGELWDSGSLWDQIGSAGKLTYSELKTVMFFVLNWARPNWDIPTFYHLISSFTGLTWDDILIEQDDTDLDMFTITLPDSDNTELLQVMIDYYKEILGLPFGVTFVIILT